MAFLLRQRFLPHVHRAVGCLVCDAVLNEEAATSIPTPPASSTSPPRASLSFSSPPPLSRKAPCSDLLGYPSEVGKSARVPIDNTHFPPRTIEEERRRGLMQWRETVGKALSSHQGTAAGNSQRRGGEDLSAQAPPMHSLEVLLRRRVWPKEAFPSLVRYLDGQCTRETKVQWEKKEAALASVSSSPSLCKRMIAIPDFIAIPCPRREKPVQRSHALNVTSNKEAPYLEDSKEERRASSVTVAMCPVAEEEELQKSSNSGKSENAFWHRIATRHDVKKQLQFQEALLAVQRALNTCQLPFFLACGTALGAHREGCFITHDDDIDLGIFHHHLIQLGKRSMQSGMAKVSASALRHGNEAQNTVDSCSPSLLGVQGLLELTSRLTHIGQAVIFDICGTVEIGLEIRLLHAPTGVRVDINVYYLPIPLHDDQLVQQQAGGGPFVWHSSFYESAYQRRHGMYRYRHQPFEHLLEPDPFCAWQGVEVGDEKTSECYFLRPPVSYLEEYFGADWRVPKAFSYTDGLQREFKNIIEE